LKRGCIDVIPKCAAREGRAFAIFQFFFQLQEACVKNVGTQPTVSQYFSLSAKPRAMDLPASASRLVATRARAFDRRGLGDGDEMNSKVAPRFPSDSHAVGPTCGANFPRFPDWKN
jgi:hypothetical protein